MKLKHHDTYCKLKSVVKSTTEQPQLQAQVAQPSLRTSLEHQLKYLANQECWVFHCKRLDAPKCS